MDHIEVAERAGVYLDDLDSLLRGRATANVANRLGVSMSDVEDFVKGSASAAMTRRLGLNTISAADELAKTVGREGAIGLVIGLLIASD
ncbi:MAG TPA: hypothetical protein VKY92_26235 [Verrucomicrobiae bacterium]|nr:hypothetical protein [Verrucomicrobiae bacterium]